MMQIQKLKSIQDLADLKKQYHQQATAPLDGMWLCGFVPVANHFGFYEGDRLVGYFCVNDEGYVLQFYLAEDSQFDSSQLFKSIVQREDSSIGSINGAFVSTAEPHFLSLCLDHFPKVEVNALMYQLGNVVQDELKTNDLTLTKIKTSQVSQAVDFALASIGAPEDWLTGYFTNLIDRQELFGVWRDDSLIATGERRGYDQYQEDYADIGMIVAKSERGKGLGTKVLRRLVAMNNVQGLKSICSTEKTNIAAQTAISRAGFVSHNRILQFHAQLTQL